MNTKKEWIDLANAILDSTGCRDICKRCNENGITIKSKYNPRGYTYNGCCGGCKYSTPKGCSSKQRSFACTFYTCPVIKRRLNKFGLGGWFKEVECTFGHSDMREPDKFKSTEHLLINLPKKVDCMATIY